ncbi:MAG: hypothetical protein GY768_17020 [Planctomycetaceae bacterium]|nr:hypothetical protein [Planctomycetaceae bacterium]
MSKNIWIQLGLFVAVLVALNFFFHLHISIIGSLVLTLVLNLVLRMFASR